MRNESVGPLLNESVDRALQLIVHLRDTGALSVKDAAEHLNIAPSTAHRLLTTLVQRHFAEQLPDRRYRPGPEITGEHAEPMTVARLRETARPMMMSLSQSLKETVQLVILRGGNIEFVDGVEGENLIRISARFGVQIPAFASAGGKALLADMSDSQIRQLYRGGLPNWPTSGIGTMFDLIESVNETRSAGFGLNFEEAERGIVGVGSVIHEKRGGAVGALTVAIPASRFQPITIPHLVEMLQQATAKIGERYQGESSSASMAAEA